MIPIFCANGMSAQGAVDEAIVQLRASKDRFDVAANALRSDAKEDPIKYKHVPEWIDACQSLCTGNVHWRYREIWCPNGSRTKRWKHPAHIIKLVGEMEKTAPLDSGGCKPSRQS
jgi:hypothetical protein